MDYKTLKEASEKKGHFVPSSQLLLREGRIPGSCEDSQCLADTQRRGKAC